MPTWSFYDAATGELTGAYFSAGGPSVSLDANTPNGCAAIEGIYDPKTQKVDITKQPPAIIAYQPAAPSNASDYQWDAQHGWILTAAALSKAQNASAVAAEIAQLLSAQLDPLRQVLIALASGNLANASGALGQLKTIDAQLATLRAQLADSAAS